MSILDSFKKLSIKLNSNNNNIMIGGQSYKSSSSSIYIDNNNQSYQFDNSVAGSIFGPAFGYTR